jgi:polysaccharide pyruvyl transferase WcaK-like protein
MLRATIKKVREAYPDAVLTMAPSPPHGTQPFRKLVDAGFFPKASFYHYGIEWGEAATLVPKRLRDMYGLVLDRDVDVVIDAAGFAYSDQWGVSNTKELADSTRRWRRRGTKVILMPQAFGPFEGKKIRKYINEAVNNADIVMPRESISYKHLTDAVGERPNIKQYPDFTNLIDGVVPRVFDPAQHRVCLVPNYRMIDKTSKKESESYLPFMKLCAQHLVECDAKPFVLIHEGERDRWLAEQISVAAGSIPILTIEDPLEIKGVLGGSYATIGSRFHGLVSALSQGVPSLATGWSHKYQELFHDYGLPEGVISVTERKESVISRIDSLINLSNQNATRTLLLDRSKHIKRRSLAMWDDVFDIFSRPKNS